MAAETVSERSEREGEAPSGFAGGGGDVSPYNSVAVILAGGKSRRFGSDKAKAKFGKKSFVEMLAETLEASQFRVWISPSMVPDRLPGKGPLQAIYSFLQQQSFPHVLVVACDMPFLKQKVVELLWKKRKGADLTLLECHSSWFPLPGVYSSSLLPQMKKLLSQERYDLKALWECPITTQVLPFSEWQTIDSKAASLININTPEEYREHVLRGD